MPVPFFANTTDDPAVLPAQRGVSDVLEMAESASLKIVGIGSVDVETQRVKSGMIERFEIEAVSNAGGIGELLGHFFDRDGNAVETTPTARPLAVSQGVSALAPQHPRGGGGFGRTLSES